MWRANQRNFCTANNRYIVLFSSFELKSSESHFYFFYSFKMSLYYYLDNFRASFPNVIQYCQYHKQYQERENNFVRTLCLLLCFACYFKVLVVPWEGPAPPGGKLNLLSVGWENTCVWFDHWLRDNSQFC